MRIATLALCAPIVCSFLVVSGCAGSVGGSVDKDGVPPLMSSYLVSDSFTVPILGTRVETAQMTWTTYGGACEFAAEDLKLQQKGGSAADDREDLYKERTPEEWWSVTVSISGEDVSDADGETLDVDGDNTGNLGIALVICHNKDFPQEDNNFLDFNQDCYRADNGELDVAYKKNEGASISASEIDMVDDDGDDAGTISFSGSASFCEDADDEFDDIFAG